MFRTIPAAVVAVVFILPGITVSRAQAQITRIDSFNQAKKLAAEVYSGQGFCQNSSQLVSERGSV
jgi:hypothetical protein